MGFYKDVDIQMQEAGLNLDVEGQGGFLDLIHILKPSEAIELYSKGYTYSDITASGLLPQWFYNLYVKKGKHANMR